MTSPATDEQTPPPLLQRREQTSGRGPLSSLFYSAGETTTETPTETPATTALDEAGETTPDLDAGPVSWDSPDDEGESADPVDLYDDAPTGSPASTPADRKPFSSAALKRVFRRGVIIAGGMAHQTVARTQGQRAVGLYLTDKDDAQNIGDPLAKIAGRRGGIGGKAMNPDVEDAVTALLGVANFVTKQVVLAGVAAKIDAGEPVDLAVLDTDAGTDEDAA